MAHSYQLTKHPVGTKREFWALAWPLMIGLISSTFMIFVDRLFLSQHHPMALNAAASSSVAYYVFLTVPMGIAAISEVLVGRLNGEKNFSEVGSASWQMVLFCLFLTPFFLLAAFFAPPLLFWGSDNIFLETAYFETLMFFGSIQCMAIALNGFFIGIGKVRIVTIAALVGNLFNISFDWLLIEGHWHFPALGIKGAAIATGIAQVIQLLILFICYWSSKNRHFYRTGKLKFNLSYFLEGLRIGGPSGFGNALEITAHFIFFRIVNMTGVKEMTLVAMVQSFYLLSSFVVEAQSKSASAIISNLLGARRFGPIPKVLKSAFTIHFFFFFCFAISTILFQDGFLNIFMSEHAEFLVDDAFKQQFFISLLLMSLFFLFDGLSWILLGFITAAGDTKFVFYTSLFVPWIAYVLPAYWLVGVHKQGASVAWAIIVFMSMTNFMLYFWRYNSGKWALRFASSNSSEQIAVANEQIASAS